MSIEEFYDRLYQCMEKALMDDLWTITNDEDEMSDICVNQDKSIRILNTSLDYKTDDVRKIQYAMRSESSDSKVLITFNDYNSIELGIQQGHKYFLIKAGDMSNATASEDEQVPELEGYPCVAFSIEDANEAWQHMRCYSIVQDFGDKCNGNFLFCLDEGRRYLAKCKKCGGYFLVQKFESHGEKDDYYADYFPVDGLKECVELNKRYDGFQIEESFPKRYLKMTNLRYHWSSNWQTI